MGTMIFAIIIMIVGYVYSIYEIHNKDKQKNGQPFPQWRKNLCYFLFTILFIPVVGVLIYVSVKEIKKENANKSYFKTFVVEKQLHGKIVNWKATKVQKIVRRSGSGRYSSTSTDTQNTYYENGEIVKMDYSKPDYKDEGLPYLGNLNGKFVSENQLEFDIHMNNDWYEISEFKLSKREIECNILIDKQNRIIVYDFLKEEYKKYLHLATPIQQNESSNSDSEPDTTSSTYRLIRAALSDTSVINSLKRIQGDSCVK